MRLAGINFKKEEAGAIMQIFSFVSLQFCLLIPSSGEVPNLPKRSKTVSDLCFYSCEVAADRLDSSSLAGPQNQLYYLPTKTVVLLVLESGCKCC